LLAVREKDGQGHSCASRRDARAQASRGTYSGGSAFLHAKLGISRGHVDTIPAL
jgi:hypothetical protein